MFLFLSAAEVLARPFPSPIMMWPLLVSILLRLIRLGSRSSLGWMFAFGCDHFVEWLFAFTPVVKRCNLDVPRWRPTGSRRRHWLTAEPWGRGSFVLASTLAALESHYQGSSSLGPAT